MEKVDLKKEFGRYEKRLLLLLMLSAVPNAFSSLQFLATHYTPDFYCSTNSSGLKFNGYITAGRIDLSSNRSLFNKTYQSEKECWIQNTSYATVNSSDKSDSVKPCKTFQFEGNVQTATSEFGLICDKAWMKPLLTSLYMAGKLFGGLLGGFVSDRYGRRIGFLLFTALQFVFSIITSFASSIPLYGVFLGISGVFSTANYEITTVIGSEMVSVKQRGLSYFTIGFGFSVGYASLALLSYSITSWRWFLVYTGLVGILYIPYYWLIDETPMWLLATGQRARAEQVLQKIAKYNGHRCDSPTDVSLIEEKLAEKSRSVTMCSTFLQMNKEWFLIGRLVVVLFSWVVASMTYYAITLNNDNLSGIRYLNIIFGAATEMVSMIVYYFGATQLGRRKSYMSFMFLTSASVAAAPFLMKWRGVAAIVASMFAKLCVGVAYAVLFTYNSELFPTNIRTSVLSLSCAASRIGSAIAPFVIFAGQSDGTVAPSLGMAVVIFISAISYLFLPETKNQKLPQNIEEAKTLNRKLKKPTSG